MYERILVGTDGSPQALDAVHSAGRLAELCGLDELHVVTACRAFTEHEMARIHAELPSELHDVVNPHLDAEDRFSEAKSVLGSALSIVGHEMSGDPADCILAAAESVGADLVVVGARGMGSIERFVRGSVSTKVAHHSACDVLVVEHDG